MTDGNVLPMPPQGPVTSGSGGGGDGFHFRLQALEEDAREIKRDLKGIDARLHSVEGDLKAIKTEMKHVATREDIQRMATDIESKLNTQLKWLLGTAGVFFLGAAGIVFRLLTIANTVKPP